MPDLGALILAYRRIFKEKNKNQYIFGESDRHL